MILVSARRFIHWKVYTGVQNKWDACSTHTIETVLKEKPFISHRVFFVCTSVVIPVSGFWVIDFSITVLQVVMYGGHWTFALATPLET